MPVPVNRVRARKPKRRTGCRTCKLRRVKCDELRPVCQRCISTGRVCDGFELPPARYADDYGSTRRQILPAESQVAIALVQPPSWLRLTSNESQGFDFFRQKTAREMPGFFGSDLWDHLILQISQQEPSILHAVIAVGSIHRHHRGSSLWGGVTQLENSVLQFGVQQYVLAIGQLRLRLIHMSEPRAAEVALITCLLFICIEMLQGRRVVAVSQLKIGLRILRGIAAQTRDIQHTQDTILYLKAAPETVIDHLSNIFARLDYEATSFAERSPELLLVPLRNVGKSDLWVPASFSNILEARQYMDTLASATCRFRGELLKLSALSIKDPSQDWATKLCREYTTSKSLNLEKYPTIMERMRELRHGLAMWSSAFENFISQVHSIVRPEDSRQILLLKTRHFYMSFIMATWRPNREIYYDSLNPQFQEAVSMARQYIDGTASEDSQYSPLPSFTLESGILPCLYLVAVKCRDSFIRWQAVSLLDHSSCQEGMWEGKLMASFVGKIIDLEESGATCYRPGITSDDVPESARISDVAIAATEIPTIGRLVCARYRHEVDGELYMWEKMIEL